VGWPSTRASGTLPRIKARVRVRVVRDAHTRAAAPCWHAVQRKGRPLGGRRGEEEDDLVVARAACEALEDVSSMRTVSRRESGEDGVELEHKVEGAADTSLDQSASGLAAAQLAYRRERAIEGMRDARGVQDEVEDVVVLDEDEVEAEGEEADREHLGDVTEIGSRRGVGTKGSWMQ
jgi:hypothetical protein